MVDDGWTAYHKVHQILMQTHVMEAFNKDNWKYDKNIPFTYKSMCIIFSCSFLASKPLNCTSN